MRSEHLTQRRVQQVRGGVIPLDPHATDSVDLQLAAIADLEGAFHNLYGVKKDAGRVSLHIGNGGRASLVKVPNLPDVANLSPRLCVER